jgi:sigma-E factor negative regulatory protein RseB
MAILLGLLGSCAAVFALADSPATSTRGRAAGLVAAGRASQRPRLPRPASAAAASSERTGRRLLLLAAAACAKIAYGGTQDVLWRGPGEQSGASVIQVWHRQGTSTIAGPAGTAALPVPQPPSGAAVSGPVMKSPAVNGSQVNGTAVNGTVLQGARGGILAVSASQLALMLTNYQVRYAGRSSADGRSARLVQLLRPDGSLAARYWLDDSTNLPLRRQVFATGSGLISDEAFIDLKVGSRGMRSMPAAQAQPWTGQLDAAGLASLRGHGWPVPASMPGDLELLRASTSSAGQPGEVLDLSYSDGLSEVSVFVQRGEMSGQLPGWSRVEVGGHSVLSSTQDSQCLAWSAAGFVYTVIADAPAATVGQVVAALPHQDRPGLWVRMARGLRRLASWANPFG